MNELKPKTNNPIIQCIEGVRGYVDADGVVQLNLEDIARGLGFTQTKSEVEYIRWETVVRHLAGCGFSQLVGKDGKPLPLKACELPEYIPEPIFYLISMKAENATARAFQHTIAYDVLPAIRKYGFYGTPATIDAILEDPDFGIKLLSEYKAEKAMAKALQVELDRSKEWYSIKRVANMNGVSFRAFDWRKLKAASAAMGYDVKKIFDANYGEVNTYHQEVWEAVYPQYEI